jgi:hypothetical protein
MGITAFDIRLLEGVISQQSPKTVIELGAQNLYHTSQNPPPYASGWYESKGISYKCIDLSGENGALKIDLAKPIKKKLGTFDLVTDFGTSEHISQENDKALGLYNCWLNKHNLLKVGGIMISENPKTGHWPLHGFHFYTEAFYKELCKISSYEILQLGENPAMGNRETGMNIYCVMRKSGDCFPAFEFFKTLDFRAA